MKKYFMGITVALLFLLVGGLYVWTILENQQLKDDVVQLNTQLKVVNNEFQTRVSEVDQKLQKKAEQISIIEESIDPKDKRWSKIKQVRKAIQKTIDKENYTKHLTIIELTTLASSIVDYSEQYDVPIPLILAITRRESAFNPNAVSPVGAQGLMQLMPETAKECADDVQKRYYNVFKVRDNVQLGTWYLWKMLYRFKNDAALAIRAYNCGPTYVEKVMAGQIVDYPKETREYVEIVLKWKKEYEDMGGL